jgi:hypothetical protein
MKRAFDPRSAATGVRHDVFLTLRHQTWRAHGDR